MELAAHSTKVCRTKVGQAQRQWTQCLLPLRSVTGATPVHFWMAAASVKRARFSPNAARRREAKMSVPSEIEQRFFAGERSERVRFAINDSVRVTAGPHTGRTAAVISLVAVEPEVVFLLEPGTPPWGDMEVPQASIELLG